MSNLRNHLYWEDKFSRYIYLEHFQGPDSSKLLKGLKSYFSRFEIVKALNYLHPSDGKTRIGLTLLISGVVQCPGDDAGPGQDTILVNGTLTEGGFQIMAVLSDKQRASAKIVEAINHQIQSLCANSKPSGTWL